MIQFTFIGQGDNQSITVFQDGAEPGQASSSHPNFQTIVKLCLASVAGDENVTAADVIELIDVGKTIEKKFSALSDRVSVRHGRVYFDGDEVETALSKQILRFLDEGEDVGPLVKFYEKVEANPSDNSRRQAFAWLNNHNFTITEDGDVIGYKGCKSDGNGGFVSTHAGYGIVDGVEYQRDYLPNYEGAQVSIPRSMVVDDPNLSCHTGLHVGTYDYARCYARNGVMMAVIVDPRDIVSVPHDASGEKIRVCRYKVHEFIELEGGEYQTAIKRVSEETDVDLTVPEERIVHVGIGDRLRDEDGDWATVIDRDLDGFLRAQYDDYRSFGSQHVMDEEPLAADTFWREHVPASGSAQRDASGRWVAGRPGSKRDPKTGRFA